jgi:glycosyltransferase involved in cell wall biosynthesis
LKQATIGCLCSDSEGFSNSILEYMAAGLPVVATRVGGASEAVIDGETGFLIRKGGTQEMAARLLELLSSRAKCQAMGLAGRRRVVESFSLAAQVSAHQDLYERLAHRVRLANPS